MNKFLRLKKRDGWLKNVFVCMLLYITIIQSATVMARSFETLKVKTNDVNYAAFIDFIYEFSERHRLNIQWFGGYRVLEPHEWYERAADQRSNFKLKIYVLTEDNGAIFMTNDFDKGRINVYIDYADRKPVWLSVVENFRQQLLANGYKVTDTTGQ